MELHGSLVEDEGSAHVRITPENPESTVDPLLVEVTVDLDNETVTVVGSDGERTAADETVTADQSMDMEYLTVTDSGDYEGADRILTTSHDGSDGSVETLSAESVLELSLSNVPLVSGN
jgi:hypothetical protein